MSVEDLVIPTTVKSIGQSAFQNVPRVKFETPTDNRPSQLERIGDHAFFNVTTTPVLLPQNVQGKVHPNAFSQLITLDYSL